MRFILSIVAVCFTAPTLAADLVPVKAPRLSILESYSGRGTYFGISTFAEVDKASVNGPVQGDAKLFTAGAAIGLSGGFLWGNGDKWTALETTIAYKNVGGSVDLPGGGTVNTRWSFTERFKIGGPIASVLNVLPNMGTVFPVLPSIGPANPSAHPYVFAAGHLDQENAALGDLTGKAWRVRAGFGVGVMQQLGNAQSNPTASKVVLDTWAEYIVKGSGFVIGGHRGAVPIEGNANTGAEARVGVSLLY